MSQSLHHAQRPEAALSEAFRILKKNGQLVILDLKKHPFEKARELYGDQWLGFAENQLYRMIKEATFERSKSRRLPKKGSSLILRRFWLAGTNFHSGKVLVSFLVVG